MNYLFRMKMAMLFLINAALLPLIMLNKDVFVSATFIIIFITVQIIILLAFAAAEDAGLYEWWAFWLTAISSVYLFIVLTSGRSLGLEWIGFILFIAYLISSVAFIMSQSRFAKRAAEDDESRIEEEELEAFRQKDELGGITGDYQIHNIPEAPKQSHLTDYPDFRKQGKPNFATSGTSSISETKNQAIFREDLQKSWEDKGIMQINENEGYYEIKPTATYDEQEAEEEGYLELYPDGKTEKRKDAKDILVTELEETPSLDMGELRKSRRELEKKTQTIDEKIRLIAEKAILEGAQKKLARALKRSQRNTTKKNKPVPVFAAITGDKFHTDRKCLALKRVKKKDIVLYASEKDAKKNKLKGCGICRR